MTLIDRYTAHFVESFPTPLERGVLYISTAYSTAGHICPCGCGREVVTKLSPARYQVIFDGEVSLRPSIAATGLPCESHYFITRGRVDWRRKLDVTQAARAQYADQRAIEAHRAPAQDRRLRWWASIWRGC
ncbi:DUF6527 family protein [Mycolicibacterium novocastrense]|uniref:Uncharacterized protein n=1 Tax=Mycolicibacterium novocastrense TaxID=59813 RepID=A0ABQ0KRB3_MYCNV|nr:putative uncharacterized protein [Mycolicibacterium novocastrense]